MTNDNLNFHLFEIDVKFPNLELNNNNKNNIDITMKIKQHLNRIYLLLKNLFFSNEKETIIYDESLINKLKIKYDTKRFKKEKIKTDLLIIVSLTSSNKNSISSKLYSNSGKHTSITEKKRIFVMLLEIDYNSDFKYFNNEEVFLAILQKVFNAIGFRYKYLLNNFIRNKFDDVPFYLIKDSKIYKSYQKYLNLKNIEIKKDPNRVSTLFYSAYWDLSKFGLHDIMEKKIFLDSSITELTIKVFNEMSFLSIAKCDLFMYKGGFGRGYNCLRVAQDCIDESIIEKNYFLEYGIYEESEIKCYLNDKNNLKNKQCGIKYGNLEKEFSNDYFCSIHKGIKGNPLISMTTIPELNIYESQKIKLLKNPLSCSANIPRTIYFSVPPYILEKFKEKEN